MDFGQKKFLATWLLQGLLLVSLPCIFIGFGIRGVFGYLAILLGIVLAVNFLYRYGFDILDGKSICVDSCVKKTSQRVRGPTLYYITVNRVQIRVPKQIWHSIEEGQKYHICYSKRSKWLLTHKLATSSHADLL